MKEVVLAKEHVFCTFSQKKLDVTLEKTLFYGQRPFPVRVEITPKECPEVGLCACDDCEFIVGEEGKRYFIKTNE